MNSPTRSRLPVLLLTALVVAGCSADSSFTLNPFAKRKGPEPETLPASEWRELRRENADRLAGVNLPRPGATTRPSAAHGVAGGFDQFMDFLEFTFWTFPKRTIQYYVQGETPSKYAKMMEDERSADQRREGILRLVADYDFARAEPYTRRYGQIAQGDPDMLVRAAAVRALNASRDPSVTPVAIRDLDDPYPLLRLESAKALANVPDEKAIPALTRHMAAHFDVRGEMGRQEMVTEGRDVRVACADALRNYPNKDVARSLVETLREREFEVSWQARRSLILMTGHDFRYDQGKWREFLTNTENPFGG
jgi:hypothetical protein